MFGDAQEAIKGVAPPEFPNMRSSKRIHGKSSELLMRTYGRLRWAREQVLLSPPTYHFS